MANLKALTDVAAGVAGPVTSAGAIGLGVSERPATAPYRTLGDSASVVSWSVDAYGKSKMPGWYHSKRKELYKQRAERDAAEPSGCYISHSKCADLRSPTNHPGATRRVTNVPDANRLHHNQCTRRYADEAVRIAATGRPAFSSSKWP